jgi:hypothetical protein
MLAMVLRLGKLQRNLTGKLLLLLMAAMLCISCSTKDQEAKTGLKVIQINPTETENAEASQSEPSSSQNQAQTNDEPSGRADSENAQVSESNAEVQIDVSYADLNPGDWKELPVIPEISANAREIYRSGVEAGNDPRVFAKVGDCQNVPSMFLSIFDYPGYYTLGEEYGYLQETIDWYHGSFSRESEAVRRGFNAASVVSPVWADPESCDQGETPLACEIRINNPSVAIISLETWWAGNPENYEKYVRMIIEGLLEHDILPIVATKADNLEGDHQINQILVRLAMEYQIPVWNFWRAVQPLPGNGLLEDRFHLTFDENQFDDPEAMKAAWPWRNLTALQVLDRVRTELVDNQ